MEAVIFIGIQASGKSTFYQQQFSKTHVRINLDMLKTRNREQKFLETCLETSQSFVVDNTNPTIIQRKRYIDSAKHAKFLVIGYYFETNIQAALSRNQEREGDERIPDKGVLGTYGQLQLPSYAEGFDQLYYVMLDDSKKFIISEWQDEIH